jgi:hypothetical protein
MLSFCLGFRLQVLKINLILEDLFSFYLFYFIFFKFKVFLVLSFDVYLIGDLTLFIFNFLYTLFYPLFFI